MFKLHKKLLKTTHSVADLNLCTARLMDNAKFPWLILIPKRKNIRQILDLNKKDQIKLMEEIDYCSRVMKKTFKAFNLNPPVAAAFSMVPIAFVVIYLMVARRTGSLERM